MTVRRRLSIAVGALVLLATVFVIPYFPSYLAAQKATKAESNTTAIKSIVESIQQIQRDNKIAVQQTNRAVTAQIPGLQAQIGRDQRTISDQQSELQQAVAFIEKLAKQVQQLGGNPGQIEIKPPS